jgi:hypothetical protein
MSRLPIPGSDNDIWGNLLNDFLGNAHNVDGSLKPIARGLLDASTQDSLGKADTALQTAMQLVQSVDGQTGVVNLSGIYETQTNVAATYETQTHASTTYATKAELTASVGTINLSDTGATWNLYAYVDGTVVAVAPGSTAPGQVGSPSATPLLSGVTLNWTAPTVPTGDPAIVRYVIIRDGLSLGSTTSGTFLDTNIVLSQHYVYNIEAINSIGLRSVSPNLNVFIDPALAAPPTASISVYPTPIPTNGSAWVRINGVDPNAFAMTFGLTVDTGTLTPTNDPTLWIYTP